MPKRLCLRDVWEISENPPFPSPKYYYLLSLHSLASKFRQFRNLNAKVDYAFFIVGYPESWCDKAFDLFLIVNE